MKLLICKLFWHQWKLKMETKPREEFGLMTINRLHECERCKRQRLEILKDIGFMGAYRLTGVIE